MSKQEKPLLTKAQRKFLKKAISFLKKETKKLTS
jgi:hypothetical protein